MGWYSANASRRYPIDDTLPPGRLVRSTDHAQLDLPTQTIVDIGSQFGPPAHFDPAIGSVYLAQVARTGSTITFTVACSSLSGTTLQFAFDVADKPWTTVWASAAESDGCGASFTWRGFLVIGDLTALAAVLPGGATLTGGPAFPFEATLAQSYRDDYVRTINIANQDRLTVATPGQAALPFDPGYHVQASCLTGAIQVEPGYNWTIDQDNSAIRLAMGASVAAGAGQPCGEVPNYPGEPTPAGSPFLTGGPPCTDLILKITGLSGSSIQIQGGLGVDVSPDPHDPHGLIVNLNKTGMTAN